MSPEEKNMLPEGKEKKHFISIRLFFIFLMIPFFFMGMRDIGRHYPKYPEVVNLFEISGTLVILFFLYRSLVSDLVPFLSERIGKERATSARYFIDFLFIASGVLIVLSLMGKGFQNLALGGTVLSIVIGVAAQSSLTNFFSGFILAFTQPFRVGDVVSIVTWQYARLASTYSHEMLAPEYRGTVLSIGMIYTRLESEEGRFFMLPNSILLQAMLFEQNPSGEHLSLRLDLPAGVRTGAIEQTIEDHLTGQYGFPKEELSLRLVDFTGSGISYKVEAPAGLAGVHEIRDSLLRALYPLFHEDHASQARVNA